MPLDEGEVQPTDEVHPLLEKMERGKYYRFVELYSLAFGKEFYVDLQESQDAKTLWLFLTKVLNLKTELQVLALLDRLKTGRRKGEVESEVRVAGHSILGGPVVYYERR